MKQVIVLLIVVFGFVSCTAHKTVSDTGNIAPSERKAVTSNSINSQSATPATPPMEKKISSKP